MSVGIYKIRNKVDEKVYVGKSKHLKSRKNEHYSLLRRNQHSNIHLQNSWNKYGECNFEYSVIEYCELHELTDYEFKWITIYKSNLSEFGYNITSPYDTYKYATHGKLRIEEKEYNPYNIKFYDRDELLSYIEEFYYMNGKVPTTRDMNRKGMPSSHNYFSTFKSFKDALIVCNLEHLVNDNLYNRKEYTKEELLRRFKDFVNDNGRFPNSEELKNTKNSNLPSQNTIYKFYKSTEELMFDLGLPSKEELKYIEKEKALDALVELQKEIGRITARDIDKFKLAKCATYYVNNFGSLDNACKLRNLKYGTRKLRNNIDIIL